LSFVIWSVSRWAELLKQVNAAFDPGRVRLIESDKPLLEADRSDNRPHHDCDIDHALNRRNPILATLLRCCNVARKMHDGPEAVASGPSLFCCVIDYSSSV